MRSVRSSLILKSLCVALTVAMLVGCGSGGGSGSGMSRATVLLATSSDDMSRTPVPDSDVLSLILTITKIDFVARTIGTVAGGEGGLGDNGPATEASFLTLREFATDPTGNLVIADIRHGRVRVVVMRNE